MPSILLNVPLVVYLLFFPFLVLGIAVGMLFAIGQGSYYLGRGVIRFFKGDSFFVPLKEDEMVAKLIKAQQDAMYEEPKPEAAPVQGPTYVQNNYYGVPQNHPNEQPQSLENPSYSQVEQQRTYIDQTPVQNQEFPAIPNNISEPEEPFHEVSEPQNDEKEDEGYDDLF